MQTLYPEKLAPYIESFLNIFLNLLQNKRDTVSEKANYMLNLSQEVFTADVLLPHCIGILQMELSSKKS